jgi:hypothetical protein
MIKIAQMAAAKKRLKSKSFGHVSYIIVMLQVVIGGQYRGPS